jgi:enolase
MKIRSLSASQIFDSKKEPTLSVKVELDDGTTAVADVPAGASTGSHEAQEKRDPDGKGVSQAIENVNVKIAAALENQPADNQALIDKIMLEIDGTPNKARLGANAILGVSLAVCRAAAKAKKLELYQYLGSLFKQENFDLPQPLMLLIEGGKHGRWVTNIQEYFVMPQKESFGSFKAAFEAGREVFYALELILKEKGYVTNLGLEGGYCPQLKSDKEALELITQAIKRTGFNLGKDLILGIDCAASEFWEQGNYLLKNQGNFKLTSSEWSKILESWLEAYPPLFA